MADSRSCSWLRLICRDATHRAVLRVTRSRHVGIARQWQRTHAGNCAATCCTISGPILRRRRANGNCATACCTIWRLAAVPARPAIESVAVTGLVDLNVLGVALAPYPTIDGFTPVHRVPAPLDSSPSLRSAPKRSMRVFFRVRTAPGPVSPAFQPVVGPHRSSASVSAFAP